jgi:tetratricopeptide (TPR) repeat protein
LLGLDPQVPTTAEGLNQEAFATCTRLIQDLPRRPEAYAVAAFIYNRHGRTTEAARCWQQALEVNPKFAPAYNGLGMVAAGKGEHEKAAELLRKAIELDPNLDHAHSLLTDVLLRQGKTQEALAAAREYVKRFPKAGDSHFWLGQALLDLEQYEEARKSHEEAIRIDPNYTGAYHSLATIYARLGQREKSREYRTKFAAMKEKELEADRGKSRAYLDLATQIQIASSYHLAAGNVHLSFGDPQKAEAHWLRGAAVAPKLVACREALVSYYQRKNRLGSALCQLDELLAIRPHNAEYWIQSGRLLARIGDPDGAEAAFRKAVELAPQSPDGYLSLAELFLQSRRKLAEAAPLAEKAAQLAPSSLA